MLRTGESARCPSLPCDLPHFPHFQQPDSHFWTLRKLPISVQVKEVVDLSASDKLGFKNMLSISDTGQSATSAAKTTILLVDDDDDLRQMLADGLEANGYSIIQADNVQSVFKQLPFMNASVAILDLVLTGASGASLLGYIKAHPRLKAIKVILMSGYDHGAQTARQWGADYFLAKPITPDKILTVLKQLGVTPSRSIPPNDSASEKAGS